jgi:hypothetical protein
VLHESEVAPELGEIGTNLERAAVCASGSAEIASRLSLSSFGEERFEPSRGIRLCHNRQPSQGDRK